MTMQNDLQIEPKYILFDAMLAVNELLWASKTSPMELNLLKLTKDLQSLYLALDIFQSLVYCSNSDGLAGNIAIKSYEERVSPLLTIVLSQVVDVERFKAHGVSIAQLQAVKTLMH